MKPLEGEMVPHHDSFIRLSFAQVGSKICRFAISCNRQVNAVLNKDLWSRIDRACHVFPSDNHGSVVEFLPKNTSIRCFAVVLISWCFSANSRPATPIIAAADIDHDVTIAPTTFELNPVDELPPPPETVANTDVAAAPTFTPYTVRPEIKNREEPALATAPSDFS